MASRPNPRVGFVLALLPDDWDGIDGYDGGGDE